MAPTRYLQGYPSSVVQQVEQMIEKQQLQAYLLKRYPASHDYSNNDQLYRFGQTLKQRYMKKAPPLKKIVFDPKVSVMHHALGLNAHITRAHGGKLKASHEIRIDPCFKRCPEPFLRMILVHELAHLKERDHNKSFYQLCQHMEPDYFQLELDLRLMLTWQEQAQTSLY